MPRVCRRKWETDGIPGCVIRRKKNGNRFLILNTDQSGCSDKTDKSWLLVCELHGLAVPMQGQRVCRDIISKPSSWCPKCGDNNLTSFEFKPDPKNGPQKPLSPPCRVGVDVSAVEAPEPKESPVSVPLAARGKSSGVGVVLMDCNHWSFWMIDGECAACKKRVPKVDLNEKAGPTDPRCPMAYRIISG